MEKFLNNFIKIKFAEIILLINKNLKFLIFCSLFFATIFYSYVILSKKTYEADIYFNYNTKAIIKFYVFKSNFNEKKNTSNELKLIFSLEKIKSVLHNYLFSEDEFIQFLNKNFPYVKNNQILIINKDYSAYEDQKFFTLRSDDGVPFDLIIREYFKYINDLSWLRLTENVKDLLSEKIKYENEAEKVLTEQIFKSKLFLNNDNLKSEIFINNLNNLQSIELLKNIADFSQYDVAYIEKIVIKKNDNKIYLISFLGLLFGSFFSLLILVIKKITK
jgi:hypothetical protein